MTRYIMIAFVLAVALGLAWAALPPVLSAGSITGGGASGAASGFRLSSAVAAYGLPDGYATVSQGGALRLENGPLPALNAQPRQNAADPIWLNPPRDARPVAISSTKGSDR